MDSLIQTIDATIEGNFTDSVDTWNRFIYHVSALPGVTILGTLKHDFPGGGFSGLIMLGESHAAIHTWPENDQAWIGLATCGDPAALNKFVRFEAKASRHGERYADHTGLSPELMDA